MNDPVWNGLPAPPPPSVLLPPSFRGGTHVHVKGSEGDVVLIREAMVGGLGPFKSLSAHEALAFLESEVSTLILTLILTRILTLTLTLTLTTRWPSETSVTRTSLP